MYRHKNSMPGWLEDAYDYLKYDRLNYFTKKILRTDIKDILIDSCFYPSSGFDITPIIALQNIIHTYVMCDAQFYGVANLIQAYYDEDRDTNRIEIEDEYYNMIVPIKGNLFKQGFVEVQKFYVDRKFLRLDDHRQAYRNRTGYGYDTPPTGNIELSFWEKNQLLYCVLFINGENSYIYDRLYIQNRMMPKGFAYSLPEGGILEFPCDYEFKPAYALSSHGFEGQLDIDRYRMLKDEIPYFGIFGNSPFRLYERIGRYEE